MSTYKIRVTNDDIQNATQGDGRSCMVWRAVTRNLQLESQTGAEPVSVNVGYDEIEFNGSAGSVTVDVPMRIGEKIQMWDDGDGELDGKDIIKPFEFDLELPDDWREQVQG